MLNVREIEEKDLPLLADYWFKSDAEYLKSLGVDLEKMPSQEQFITMLKTQLALPYEEKKGYALIWESDGKPIGHSNVNPIVYRKEASMHIHIWNSENRSKGYGRELITMSLPFYFKNLELEKIYCEPYALNNAPNSLLEKSGFSFIKEYTTTPGSITFEQPVKRWEIQRSKILND